MILETYPVQCFYQSIQILGSLCYLPINPAHSFIKIPPCFGLIENLNTRSTGHLVIYDQCFGLRLLLLVGALQVLAGLAGEKRFPPLPRLPQPHRLCLLNCSGGFQVRRIRFRPQRNLLTATFMIFKAFLMFLPQNSD